MFGSSKCAAVPIPFHSFLTIFPRFSSSTLLTIFGGQVDDLETLLIEERLPEGWESRIRERNGLTILTFNKTALKVEHGIDEKKFAISATADSDKVASPSSIQKPASEVNA